MFGNKADARSGFFGASYTAKGGDDALTRRYEALTALAQERGLVDEKDPERSLVPEQLKSAAARVADFISRPNYAVAGFVDTLQGTGKPGEYAFTRAFRELVSGIGSVKGDKEVFGDVLKQRGVAEGGKLSDLVPDWEKTWVGSRVDPTARGTAGLALDILLDPLTWITTPANMGFKALTGTGDVVKLTKKGRQIQTAFLEKQKAIWRKTLGLSDDLDDMDLMRALQNDNRFLQEHKALANSLSATSELPGAGMVAMQNAIRIEETMMRTAASQTQRLARRVPGLLTPDGLRFRPFGLVDLPIGLDQMAKTQVKAAYARVKRLVELNTGLNPKLQDRLATFDQFMQDTWLLFNRIPFLASKLPGYQQLQAQHWMLQEATDAMSNAQAKHLLQGVPEALRFDRKLWSSFAAAVEGPIAPALAPKRGFAFVEAAYTNRAARLAWFEQARKKGIEAPERLMQRWIAFADAMGATEVKANLFDANDFAALRGRYYPRTADISNREFARVQKALTNTFKRGGAFRGPNLGGYKEHRTAPSYAAWAETLVELRLDHKIVYDPFEIMRRRIHAHNKAMVEQQFMEDAVALMGVGNNPAMRAIIQRLDADKAPKLTEPERDTVQRILAHDPIYAGGRRTAQQAIRNDILVDAAASPETIRLYQAKRRIGEVSTDIKLAQARRKELEAVRRVATGKAMAGRAKETKRLLSGQYDAPSQTMAPIPVGMEGTVAGATESLVAGIKASRAAKIDADLILKKVDARLDHFTNLTEKLKANASLLPRGVRVLIEEQEKALKRTRSFFSERGARLGADKELLEVEFVRLKDIARKLDSELDRTIAVREAAEQTVEQMAERKAALAEQESILRNMRTLYKREMRDAREAAGFNRTIKEQRELDAAAFRELPPRVQAHVAHELLRRARTLDQVASIFENYGAAIRKIDDRTFAEAAGQIHIRDRRAGITATKYAGQDYIDHKFTHGTLAGTTWSLPRGVVQDLETFKGAWQQNDEVRGILRLFDYLTNTFKLGVTTYFPSFNTRNAYSNVFASSLDIGLAAANPVAHVEMLRVLAGVDGTLRMHNGAKLPYDAVRRELTAMGVTLDRVSIVEMAGRKGAFDFGTLLNPAVRKATKGKKTFTGAAATITAGIENEARALHYITLRRRGYTSMEAAQRVNDFLFDYENLSAFEKNVMRRIVPFYTWTSKNMRRQIRNLADNPGMVAAHFKLFAGDRGPDADALPEYLRGQLSLRIDGGFLANIDLPVSNINTLWAGGVGKTIREHVGMMNPLIKMPFEWALDIDTFSGKNIKGRKWLGRMGPALERNLPQWALDWLEVDKITLGNGETAYKANGTKLYLLTKGLFLGRFMSEATTVDSFVRDLGNGNAQTGATAALRFFTGLQVRDMDLTTIQEQTLRNRLRRLEEILLESGAMAEIKKRYVPSAGTKKTKPQATALFGGTGAQAGTNRIF